MSFPISDSVLKNVSVLASDIDETITIDTTIYAKNLALISMLRQVGVKVILVTGRTAGHAFTLTTYFDVDAAIAENGGVICVGETVRVVPHFKPETFVKIKEVFRDVLAKYPFLRETQDNFMRMTDQTFYVHDVPKEVIEETREIAAKSGLGVIYSSVHVHIYDPNIDKGSTLKLFLEEQGAFDPEKIIAIGDSPNDEGLFDPSILTHTVGVKNVEKYLKHMTHTPRYILDKHEGDGFAMLAEAILNAKS